MFQCVSMFEGVWDGAGKSSSSAGAYHAALQPMDPVCGAPRWVVATHGNHQVFQEGKGLSRWLIN